MAHRANPLDLATRQDNAEIHVVISFIQDCSLDCFFPLNAILGVDAFEPSFPRRGPLSRIKSVNPIPLLGKVCCAATYYIPDPATRESQPLRLGQIRLLTLQLLRRLLLFCDVHSSPNGSLIAPNL